MGYVRVSKLLLALRPETNIFPDQNFDYMYQNWLEPFCIRANKLVKIFYAFTTSNSLNKAIAPVQLSFDNVIDFWTEFKELDKNKRTLGDCGKACHVIFMSGLHLRMNSSSSFRVFSHSTSSSFLSSARLSVNPMLLFPNELGPADVGVYLKGNVQNAWLVYKFDWSHLLRESWRTCPGSSSAFALPSASARLRSAAELTTVSHRLVTRDTRKSRARKRSLSASSHVTTLVEDCCHGVVRFLFQNFSFRFLL